MSTVTIHPEWDAPTTPLRHSWAGIINVDQFRWLVRRDMQEQLRLAHDEIGARHVRAVGMFDDEMRVLALDPTTWREKKRKPRLNWQIVDYVIESLLELGLKPMFTTTFMPTALASGSQTVFSTRSNVTPPRDLAAWTQLVETAVRHAIEQFGVSEVRQWYFEVWNEPNLNAFWAGTREQFYELWVATYRAIKNVDAALRVGGPSTARAEWLAEFIEFGRNHDCAPDYLITHIYNNDSETSALSPFDGPQEDKASRSPHFATGVIRGTRALLNQLNYRGEIHFNEWGRSWHPCEPGRETANEAAWIVKTMAEASQCADRFAYWCVSDIYDQLGYGAEAFHGNYGMLSLHGLRKPAWFAHQLLCRLGEQAVPCRIQDAPPCTGAICARTATHRQVLIYSFNPSADTAVAALDVQVEVPAGPSTLWRVDSRENNILTRWRELGAPAYLRRDQLTELRAANVLRPTSDPIERTGNRIRFRMESPGIALLEVAGS